MQHQFSTGNKLSLGLTGATANGAAGTTDLSYASTGAVICDTEGFEGLTIAIQFGTITSGAVTSIKAQHGDASTLSDAADIAGTSQTVADTDDDKLFYIDIYRPTKRYVCWYVDRGTQNAVVAAVTYLQYGARKQPVSHGSGVSGEAFVSPASGTA